MVYYILVLMNLMFPMVITILELYAMTIKTINGPRDKEAREVIKKISLGRLIINVGTYSQPAPLRCFTVKIDKQGIRYGGDRSKTVVYWFMILASPTLHPLWHPSLTLMIQLIFS